MSAIITIDNPNSEQAVVVARYGENYKEEENIVVPPNTKASLTINVNSRPSIEFRYARISEGE